MSVIQRIRDKAAWFIFGAIALSLLAFILQDAFSGKGGSMFSNKTTVGKVNGVSIERTDFENKINFYQQANGAQRDQLIGNVWEYMVDQTVMKQEYDKLGLQMTTKELSDLLFGNNPPSWMQQAFTDPNTGMYNAAEAAQQFSQMKKNANDPRNAQLYEGYLEPTMQQTLRQKYQALITGAIYVPKWIAEKTNADNNALAKISFVSVPYTSISDSAVKVSDEDIVAYVNKHPKQFQQKEETRQISYVTFGAAASKDDSAATLSQLMQLKNEFQSAADEKSFLAKNGSELPYYNSYIGAKEIKQTVKDSLLRLSSGSVYGPYLDNNNYVVAKIVSTTAMPDSVTVRHILVATHQSDQSSGQTFRVRDDSAARKRLDTAVSLINSGVGFDSVCLKYSDDPGSASKGGVYEYFASGRMVEEFNDFVFTGKPGDKKIIQTSYGYHYVEILGQKGAETGYKIAYLAKPIVASQETVDAANTAATQFAASSRDKLSFDKNAAKLNKLPLIADQIKANDFTVQSLGDSRTLVRWVYDNETGDVSEPFEINGNFVVAVITGVNKAGLFNASTARPLVESIVRNEKKAQQIIANKIKGATLEEIAKNAGTSVMTVDSISFQAYVIPNIGNEVKIIGAAFNKDQKGKVSAPIAGTSAVFVIKGENVYAGSSLSGTPETIRQSLETQIKSQAGYRSANAVREAADVKDYRSDFY